MAGVLALEPEILILDEPTAGLDFNGIYRVKNILLELNDKGVTVILISHNLDLVAALAKRVIFLKQGKVLYDGPKTNFFKQVEKLKEEGIRAPETVELFHSLISAGFQVRDYIYETEEIIEELFSIFGKTINRD
jgi:energy-coupling factor transporter ATP-binding protein EcfA2